MPVCGCLASEFRLIVPVGPSVVGAPLPESIRYAVPGQETASMLP